MAENTPSRSGRFHRSSSWSFQQIHQNSHRIASTASQRLHDYVRGLGPIISPDSEGPAHGPFTRHSHSHGDIHTQAPPPPVHSLREPDFVIDIDPIDSSSSGQGNSTSNRNNDTAEDGIEQSLRNFPELQRLLNFSQRHALFAAILLLKLLFDHRIGVLVNFGLFITLCHANAVLKREIARQSKWKLSHLCVVFLNLVLSITVIYTLLADFNLAYALVLIPPYSAPIDFCELLWIVTVTDFVIRLITVLIKMLFIILPLKLIAHPKRGKYYLFVERTSQLYRVFAPMQHWLYYFSEFYKGPSKVFGVVLAAMYLIFKCKMIFKYAQNWRTALVKIIQNKTYGVAPSTNEIKEAGDACPICQDDYKSPAKLQCKHIFCEECVALWFDRERTCPICRAQIADDPTWRDGATQLMLQIS